MIALFEKPNRKQVIKERVVLTFCEEVIVLDYYPLRG